MRITTKWASLNHSRICRAASRTKLGHSSAVDTIFSRNQGSHAIHQREVSTIAVVAILPHPADHTSMRVADSTLIRVVVGMKLKDIPHDGSILLESNDLERKNLILQPSYIYLSVTDPPTGDKYPWGLLLDRRWWVIKLKGPLSPTTWVRDILVYNLRIRSVEFLEVAI